MVPPPLCFFPFLCAVPCSMIFPCIFYNCGFDMLWLCVWIPFGASSRGCIPFDVYFPAVDSIWYVFTGMNSPWCVFHGGGFPPVRLHADAFHFICISQPWIAFGVYLRGRGEFHSFVLSFCVLVSVSKRNIRSSVSILLIYCAQCVLFVHCKQSCD